MTKKFLSLLLAVLMVLSMAVPAMATPLDGFEPLGEEQTSAESKAVAEPQAAVGGLDPIGGTGAEIQASKPSKLTKSTVDKMQIRAYGFAKDDNGKKITGDAVPSKVKANGVSYTIGEVEGNDVDGYTTTVTFHFAHGDKFEAAASDVFNTNTKLDFYKAGISGNWVYSFSDDRPADQVLTLYWVMKGSKAQWCVKVAPSKLTPDGYSTNLTSGIANIIKVNLRLDTDTSVNHSVIYKDGMNGMIFLDRTFSVEEGSPTPAFDGNLAANDNYEFVKWTPDVAETVTEDAVYTATWKEVQRYSITFNGNGTNQLSGAISGNYTSGTKYTAGTNVNLNTAMDGKKFTKALSDDYSTNYRQTGWNTKADGTGTHYDMNGTFVMPDYDVTLYAEWEAYEWIHWNVQMSEGGDYINYSTGYTGPKADVQSFKAYTGNLGNSYGKVPAAYYTPVKAVAKVGYKFIGWYDVAKNECISTNDTLYVDDFRNLRELTLAESGAVLEARFEAKKASNIHVVIYKASNLTKPVVSMAITNLYAGDTFAPNIADYYSSANGYEYVGWFNDGNFNNYKAGKNYTEATEFTVSGNWQNVIAVVTDYEKVVVKAVYDGDKENAKTVYSGLALRGTNVIEFLEANAGVGEVKGHTLDKWFNWDWYGHKVADNATVNGWTNVYVTYDRNSYTVKYVDGADGAAFAEESYTVKYGDPTPAFKGSLTAYPGWKFKAWTPDLADTVTEDVTYTATWEPKGANTIIYWGNGGTRSKYSVGDTFWSEYTSAAEIKVRGNGFLSFALDEYAFNGWNTKADGTGDSYKSGDMYKFTAAHDLDKANLYAQWKLIAFNVSFNSNGGNTLDPIKVTLNKPYGTLPSAGSINGLQNLGWYLVDEQGNVTDTAVNAKTVVTLERDHTLFQKREIKTPTVKISLSRPVYNYLDKPVSLNASLTEYPALKYSYQWYKDGVALANDDLYDGVNTKSLTLKHDYVSASGVYKLVVTVTLADGSDIVVTNSPVTAEASYTLNIRRTSNMLYYDANGGEGGPSNNSDYYDKANDRYVAKVQSSQPTRSEWKFIGWNTKADGTGDSYKAGDFYVFDRQLSENGGLKAWLYAQWDHLTCAENLEDVKVITKPTCTEKGLKLCRCTVCGDEYKVEIPALGHDHGGRWTWNREEHWKKCLRCGAIIDCEEHTYGDWKPVVDEKGKDTDREERSCTVCGFTQYAQTIHIGGSTVTKPTDEQNPNTGAQVPSLLPALAVLAGAAVVLRKRK